jgi:hypothetical protein
VTLNLPRLSPHLRQRAQDETGRILRRVGRMRIVEIEPFLIGRSSSPRIAVHIDLKISRRETLRRLSMRIADPKEPDLLRQVIVCVFGNRKEDAIAIESLVYISVTTELLARRYPNGRPYYTAADATLERLLIPTALADDSGLCGRGLR